MASKTTNTTILLDIYERLGIVETQNQQILEEQGRVRADAAAIAQDVADVARDLAVAKQRVDTMEPDVSKMAGFRLQVSIAVVFVTAVVTGAINLVWLGFTHLSDIKAAIQSFLR